MSVEWWIVLATLGGPVIAVQTQKFIERATEARRRRALIFQTLMANRAARLNEDFVKALNSIDLVFQPSRFFGAKDRAVIDAWRAYFGELNNGLRAAGPDPDAHAIQAWGERCNDRLVALLSAMSRTLGYGFSEEQLRRGIYHPQAYVDREQTVLAILAGLRAVLEGRDSLRMKITEAPAPAELQAMLTDKLIRAYDEDGALKVRIRREAKDPGD